MSDPVGNAPRGTNISGNSHRVREEQAAQATPSPKGNAAPEPTPVQKIVTGKVVSKKAPWYKRAAASMVAEDIPNVGEAIFFEVIMPGIKRLVRDAAVGSIDRVLLGKIQPNVGSSIVGGIVGGMNQSRLSTRYDQMSNGQPMMGLSAAARARHAFNEITLQSLDEANAVIVGLIERIQLYGTASVAELYAMLGMTNPQGNYMDRGFGWTDLSTASVRQTAAGWMLDLPNPEPFR